MTGTEARRLKTGDRIYWDDGEKATVESIGGYAGTCINVHWDDGAFTSLHADDMGRAEVCVPVRTDTGGAS